MHIEQFIENNRQELQEIIGQETLGFDIDNEEIELWILNDEGLYKWALSEGVEI